MSDDTKKLRRLAGTIQMKTIQSGVVCLVKTDEGKAVAIPANDVELLAVYSDGVTVDMIAEDLAEAGVQA